MRILIVHNYYQVPGGEDTVVANEKKLLEDQGHEVFLYTRNNNELTSMSILRKMVLPFTTIFNPRTYRDIKRIIKEKNIQIVHVHNTLNLISPSVYYAANKCGIPVVQTIHNFRLLCPGATFYRDGHICEDCTSKGLRCAINHKCYRNSRAQTMICVINTFIHRLTGIYGKLYYIALTEFTKEKLLKLKQIKSDRIFVKPNFTSDVIDPIQYPHSGDYYIFVGRIEEIKGINLLIDAFKELPEDRILVIGTGTLENKIKDRISREGIQNVSLLGFVPHDRVKEHIIKSKALIMCSQWYETFGMVISEAYSCKIPVIVGNIGNIKDLVIEGKTGYKFIYNSKESLKEAIVKMDNADAIELGKNAYELFKSGYTEKSNYNQIMKIYDTVLKK